MSLIIYGITLLVLSKGVTVDDINQLRIELRDEFDQHMQSTPWGTQYRSLLATTVRLVFHDCSGPGEAGSTEVAQCNGCIDFQNDDHAGLQQGAVEPLQDIYLSGWNQAMSRADFWSAAGIIIIIHTQINLNLHLTFTYTNIHHVSVFDSNSFLSE